MSRVTASPRKTWIGAAFFTVASLALAACGSTTAVIVPPHINGTPSVSIDVALQKVACTTAGTCIAVGADDSLVAPSAIGEVAHANATWSPITLPSTLSQSVTAISCWSSQCLIGGALPSSDSLWDYSPSNQSVSVATAPDGGRGVSALDCFAKAACAMVDNTGITGASRLSFTSDGSTWSTPLVMAWTAGDAVTALSCSDDMNCTVAATNSRSRVLLEVTHDGGATWVVRPVPSTWTTLTSLDCSALDCVALAGTTSSPLLIRTGTNFRLFRSITLADTANAIACARISRCVLAGQTPTQGPWLATLKGLKMRTLALKYVPTGLLDVACGVKTCAAIGASTVLSFKP
jgi:hypothetical protein